MDPEKMKDMSPRDREMMSVPPESSEASRAELESQLTQLKEKEETAWQAAEAAQTDREEYFQDQKRRNQSYADLAEDDPVHKEKLTNIHALRDKAIEIQNRREALEKSLASK